MGQSLGVEYYWMCFSNNLSVAFIGIMMAPWLLPSGSFYKATRMPNRNWAKSAGIGPKVQESPTYLGA